MAAAKAWRESGQPEGSELHKAYMGAKAALELAKKPELAAKPIVAPVVLPRCCDKAETRTNCVCMAVSVCPVHGEVHHGTHD